MSYTYDENDNILSVTDSHGTITRTYDKLNRVLSYTDTYGRTIGYAYDSVGNLIRITYPDNTFVSYEYDANHNLVKVIDWNGRWVVYTYDENNRVTSKINPDLSHTGIVYDDMQRVTSNVEYDRNDNVICGFEYTYDDLSRIVEEKILDKNLKFCYTYDNLSRVTKRETKSLDNAIISEETFTYDAAGNITDAPDTCFAYDRNNKLTVFCGQDVTYDLDGNMLSCGSLSFDYDSANRLIATTGNVYTYNAEDVRIKDLYLNGETTYTYNTNCALSQLLWKTEGGVTTKYVYGLGLLYEETNGNIKIYHYDNRGSTVALTNESGNITDTFAYDTYGKQISHVGTSNIIFGYNGRDGVITDQNGLIYMRARYYSPDMKRFINADIVKGKITNAVTLNRYAYANANPVTNTDPLGLYGIAGKPNNRVFINDVGGGGGGTVVTPKPSTTTSAAQSPTATAPATTITPTAPSHSEYATIRDGGAATYIQTTQPPQPKIIMNLTQFQMTLQHPNIK